MSEICKLPISAVVVSCNEVGRLEECLKSLSFCDEIIVCDLHSNDGSAEIGKELADKFFQKPRVDFVELLWGELFSLARNDWVLRFDPDQVVPKGLVSGISDALNRAESASCIRLPLLYYFLGQPLHFSVWGKVRYFPLLLNRKHSRCSGLVHEGIHFDSSKNQIQVSGLDCYAIEHYWVDSIWQMLRKHFRYLKHEGASRTSRGERFEWRRALMDCRASFSDNFINGGCLKSGWRGLYLGIFHLTYVVGTQISLAASSISRSLSAKY